LVSRSRRNTKKGFRRWDPVFTKSYRTYPGGSTMNVWRWSGALAFLAVLGLGFSAAGGDKAEKLEWKAFNKDSKPFYQEMETNTTQDMKVQGMQVRQEQKQTFWIKWTPVKDEKDSWTVKQKIAGVKMNINIGGNTIDYDSTQANPPANPLTEF